MGAQLSGRAFVYILTAVIAVLVLLFGYRSIVSLGESGEKAMLINFRNSLANDAGADSSYGAVKTHTYELPGRYKELCFLDLSKKDEIKNSVSAGLYPIIKDSVESDAWQNVFLFPGGEPFYAGNLSIEHYPHFKCFEIRDSTVEIRLRGLGDSTAVMTSFVSTSLLDLDEQGRTKRETILESTDGVVILSLAKGTLLSPLAEELSVELVPPGGSEQHSESYNFLPTGTSFNPSATLFVKYSPSLVGYECPGSLTFTYNGNDYRSASVDCSQNQAVFEMDKI